MKKIFYAGVFFISTSISMFVGSGLVYADNQVQLKITTDTVWGLEGSPYIVNGRVEISKGANLNIEPGVSVKFNDGENGYNGSLVILGSLHAQGSASKPIIFSSGVIGKSWGISFTSSTSTLSYVKMSDSADPFTNPIFGKNSNLKIDHLSINNVFGPIMFNNSQAQISASNFQNGAGALSLYNKSNVTVSNSMFHGVSAQNMNSVIMAYDHSNLVLDNVTVENITDGSALAVYTNSSAKISSSTIQHGPVNGISVYKDSFVSLEKTKIDDFAEVGIMAYSNADVRLDHSTISNTGSGIEIYSSTTLHVSSSDIYDNKLYGIYNISGRDVDARNIWWGDPAGPMTYLGDRDEAGSEVKNAVSGNVLFDPWLTADPLIVPKCCSSVAFIPGLEGSRLYTPATLFGENQLWEPNRNADVEKLYLDNNGNSVNGDIYTKDIIDESKIGGLNIYKNFEQSMDSLVSDKTIREWKALPYDWRKNVNDLVVGGTVMKNDQGGYDVLNFVKEIERLAASSTTGKVTVIAHSNGGLITKLLVKELEKRGEAGLVDNVILVAVPELGTPKSIPALLHGFDQGFAGGWILKESVARGLGQNMPGAYGLLPSQEYFNRVSDPVVLFDASVTATSSPFVVFGQYGKSLNSFNQLQSFLLGEKDSRIKTKADDTSQPIALNQKLLNSADQIHTTIDAWKFPGNISVSQVVGWGLDTVSGVKYIVKEDCSTTWASCEKYLDQEPVFTSDGDNTVVTPSASAVDGKTYYVDLPKHNAQLFGLRRNRGHADILEVTEIQQLLKNIIAGTSTLPSLVTTSKPTADPKQKPGLHVSVHSPVSLDVYDSYGNHTGLIPNPDPNSDIELVEENIPNSYYLNFGEGKYIGVPDTASTTIRLQGLGFGTFTLNIDNGTASSTFTDIPVTPATVASLDVASTTNLQLKLDVNGDGQVSYVIKPNTALDPALYLKSMKQIVMSFKLNKALEKDLLNRIDKALNLVTKGKIAKAESKIKKLIFKTQTKKKFKKIEESDKEKFTTMLNQLLNNLK